MALTSVTKGKLDTPYRVTMFGPEGVGKSTFGADAPSPIFLGAEDGTQHLDVARFPRPETFADVIDAIRVLVLEAHEYQTLVVDTLDWVEPLIWREVVRRDDKGATTIEEVGGGFKVGYNNALDDWRKLIASLEYMQKMKRIHVVLLAHSYIKSFKNPEGEDYDRYQMKLHEKAAGVVKEWSDAVLFARQETLVHKEKRSRARGVAIGARLIHTERGPAFDAKNRYSLPAELPLSWADFDAAAKAGRVASPQDLQREITRKADELGGDLKRVIIDTMIKAASNTQSLAKINNRCNAKLAEKAASQPTAPNAEKAS